jgi:hypothetical protein
MSERGETMDAEKLKLSQMTTAGG